VNMLEVRTVTVRFGGLTAVDNVSLSIPEGTVAAVIGPNGAGKSTLVNVAAGIQRPAAGRVFLAGEDVTRLPAHKRAGRGLARTFQRLEVFGTLSVRDNLLVAAEARRATRPVRANAVVDQLLDDLGLAHLADQLADTQPTGIQRLVELGRALALKPRVLLLDEASSGLSRYETQQVSGQLKRLSADGLTVVLVEHDMPFVLSTCGHIAMLDHGVLVAEGTPAQVCAMPVVQEAYLGKGGLAA
jgi:branched-chain amino acid transport system ATP-binding protein